MYPVESVVGAFAITTTLSKKKMLDDTNGLASIPINGLRLITQMPELDSKLPQILQHWPSVRLSRVFPALIFVTRHASGFRAVEGAWQSTSWKYFPKKSWVQLYPKQAIKLPVLGTANPIFSPKMGF